MQKRCGDPLAPEGNILKIVHKETGIDYKSEALNKIIKTIM